MGQSRRLAVVTLAVVGLLIAPAVGLATLTDTSGDAGEAEPLQGNATANATAPGERLAGVVGVGAAELEGELDQRAFGLRFAGAAGQQARADVVAGQLDDIEQRLTDIQQRKATLDEQRAAGEVSERKYRVEVAKIAARGDALARLNNQTGQAAGRLPTDVLAERGVDAERIRAVGNRARNLSDGEAGEIARGITGDPPGGNRTGGPPIDSPGDSRMPAPSSPGGNDLPGNGPGDRPDNPRGGDQSSDP